MCEFTPKISCTTTRPPRGVPDGAARYTARRWPSSAVSVSISPMVVLLPAGTAGRVMVPQARPLHQRPRIRAPARIGREAPGLGEGARPRAQRAALGGIEQRRQRTRQGRGRQPPQVGAEIGGYGLAREVPDDGT